METLYDIVFNVQVQFKLFTFKLNDSMLQARIWNAFMLGLILIVYLNK
jgi:hypothetical protein